MAKSKSKSKALFGSDSYPLEFNPVLTAQNWTEFDQLTTNCQSCSLHETRSQVVCARYSSVKEADLLIVGEGPGEVEDRKGLAFVGDSGKLLDVMLESVGLDSFYITNVVRCRPPDNRNPNKTELQSCLPFLKTEIAFIKPKVILCLGKIATKVLLDETGRFEKLMRCRHQYYEYPVWVTYHPAYLLREPQLSEYSPKWEAWQVLSQVKLYLEATSN